MVIRLALCLARWTRVANLWRWSLSACMRSGRRWRMRRFADRLLSSWLKRSNKIPALYIDMVRYVRYDLKVRGWCLHRMKYRHYDCCAPIRGPCSEFKEQKSHDLMHRGKSTSTHPAMTPTLSRRSTKPQTITRYACHFSNSSFSISSCEKKAGDVSSDGGGRSHLRRSRRPPFLKTLSVAVLPFMRTTLLPRWMLTSLPVSWIPITPTRYPFRDPCSLL